MLKTIQQDNMKLRNKASNSYLEVLINLRGLIQVTSKPIELRMKWWGIIKIITKHNISQTCKILLTWKVFLRNILEVLKLSQ